MEFKTLTKVFLLPRCEQLRQSHQKAGVFYQKAHSLQSPTWVHKYTPERIHLCLLNQTTFSPLEADILYIFHMAHSTRANYLICGKYRSLKKYSPFAFSFPRLRENNS